MQRKADESKEGLIFGVYTVQVETWIEPEQESHEDVYGEPAPEGCEGWTILVRASVVSNADRWEAEDSLGHVWVRPDAEGRKYLQAERDDIESNALRALEAEIKADAQGVCVQRAILRESTAKELLKVVAKLEAREGKGA